MKGESDKVWHPVACNGWQKAVLPEWRRRQSCVTGGGLWLVLVLRLASGGEARPDTGHGTIETGVIDRHDEQVLLRLGGRIDSRMLEDFRIDAGFRALAAAGVPDIVHIACRDIGTKHVVDELVGIEENDAQQELPLPVNYSFTKTDFLDNEAENMHTENAVELAMMFGTKEEQKRMNMIMTAHNTRGYILPDEQEERDALVRKYYPMLETKELQLKKIMF